MKVTQSEEIQLCMQVIDQSTKNREDKQIKFLHQKCFQSTSWSEVIAVINGEDSRPFPKGMVVNADSDSEKSEQSSEWEACDWDEIEGEYVPLVDLQKIGPERGNLAILDFLKFWWD